MSPRPLFRTCRSPAPSASDAFPVVRMLPPPGFLLMSAVGAASTPVSWPKSFLVPSDRGLCRRPAAGCETPCCAGVLSQADRRGLSGSGGRPSGQGVLLGEARCAWCCARHMNQFVQRRQHSTCSSSSLVRSQLSLHYSASKRGGGCRDGRKANTAFFVPHTISGQASTKKKNIVHHDPKRGWEPLAEGIYETSTRVCQYILVYSVAKK